MNGWVKPGAPTSGGEVVQVVVVHPTNKTDIWSSKPFWIMSDDVLPRRPEELPFNWIVWVRGV